MRAYLVATLLFGAVNAHAEETFMLPEQPAPPGGLALAFSKAEGQNPESERANPVRLGLAKLPETKWVDNPRFGWTSKSGFGFEYSESEALNLPGPPQGKPLPQESGRPMIRFSYKH